MKLMKKYLKLILADEEVGEEEGEFEEPAEVKELKRKIELVWCKNGRGNSYVVTAYGIGADGKINSTKETEYKIHWALLSLIKAATMAGFNYKKTLLPQKPWGRALSTRMRARLEPQSRRRRRRRRNTIASETTITLTRTAMVM